MYPSTRSSTQLLLISLLTCISTAMILPTHEDRFRFADYPLYRRPRHLHATKSIPRLVSRMHPPGPSNPPLHSNQPYVPHPTIVGPRHAPPRPSPVAVPCGSDSGTRSVAPSSTPVPDDQFMEATAPSPAPMPDELADSEVLPSPGSPADEILDGRIEASPVPVMDEIFVRWRQSWTSR